MNIDGMYRKSLIMMGLSEVGGRMNGSLVTCEGFYVMRFDYVESANVHVWMNEEITAANKYCYSTESISNS